MPRTTTSGFSNKHCGTPTRILLSLNDQQYDQQYDQHPSTIISQSGLQQIFDHHYSCPPPKVRKTQIDIHALAVP